MEAKADQIGIAILGCGYWGINYVRAFSELPEARVVVVCDQRPERLQEVGRRFPGVALTTEVEMALQMPNTEAVVICTEATTHYCMTHRCLASGKHVLIEKPMTTTVIDAQKLIELAESKKVILMVGHTFLYNAGIRKVKDYIEQAELGQIYYLYGCRTNLGPIRRDVNALWDLAPHDVSIFNYLLGNGPEWVSAVGSKILHNCREDVGFVSLGYHNDIIGHIHVSWADPNKVREIVVVGSEKRIVFNDLNPLEQVRVFEKGIAPVESEAATYGEHQFRMRDGNIVSPKVEVSEPLKNQCSHFLECIRLGSRPLTSGWEGREVVRVMAAIDRSIELKGVPVEVV